MASLATPDSMARRTVGWLATVFGQRVIGRELAQADARHLAGARPRPGARASAGRHSEQRRRSGTAIRSSPSCPWRSCALLRSPQWRGIQRGRAGSPAQPKRNVQRTQRNVGRDSSAHSSRAAAIATGDTSTRVRPLPSTPAAGWYVSLDSKTAAAGGDLSSAGHQQRPSPRGECHHRQPVAGRDPQLVVYSHSLTQRTVCRR